MSAHAKNNRNRGTHLSLGAETNVRACTVRVRVFVSALASVLRTRRALALPLSHFHTRSEERFKCGRDGRDEEGLPFVGVI